MRGKIVKQLREAVWQANVLSGKPFELKKTKRNHQGGRKTFTRSAIATGYFCSRPVAQHRKAMIAAKHERMVESDI